MNDMAPDDREESLLSHLVELRTRLLKAVAAVVLVLIALLPFAQQLYTWLSDPLVARLPAGSQLVAIEVASPFFAPIKLAFFVAVILAMPVVLYQLWAFVAPGLYRHEKRLAMPLLVSATLLFYAGCAFAYYLVLPVVFGFLTSVTPENVAMMTDISRYLDFVMMLFLAFGASFEVPVAVVILAALGVVDIAQLKQARGYVVVGAFVVAAILTPPDVISQLMLAIPMCLLYELGIVAARFVRPQDAAAARAR
ncbi:twin-arginine translocase subunit TatC [Coralloluteibacterium thermophilus]|uniref:Sec-independent protein translocase protein TatC n=1 Tax=Coralloluteibacterium thermophilum TaxID=2707049 RepID=A0ABV9NPE6_9GAMM